MPYPIDCFEYNDCLGNFDDVCACQGLVDMEGLRLWEAVEDCAFDRCDPLGDEDLFYECFEAECTAEIDACYYDVIDDPEAPTPRPEEDVVEPEASSPSSRSKSGCSAVVPGSPSTWPLLIFGLFVAAIRYRATRARRTGVAVAVLLAGCMPDTGGGAGDGGLPAVGDPCPWTPEEAEQLIAEARCPVWYEEDRGDGLFCLPMTEMAEYRGETIRLQPVGRGFVGSGNFKVPVEWGSAVCTDGLVTYVHQIVLVPWPDGPRTLDACPGGVDCDPCEADAGACEPYRGE